jgi:hypothetical protein
MCMRQGTTVTPPRRTRRRRRALWWLLLPVAIAAAVYGAASAYATPAIDGAIARAVRQQLHGSVSVSLRPGPLWQLLYGRFERLVIKMPHLSYQGLDVDNARLLWRNGQVRLQPLLQSGQVDIVRQGSLTVSGMIPAKFIESSLADAIRPYIPSGSVATIPDLSITPKAISLDGDVVVLGVRVPYRFQGVLKIASGGKALEFQTDALNGSLLSLPAIPIFEAAQIPRVDGLSWRFSSVRLQTGYVFVALRNAP